MKRVCKNCHQPGQDHCPDCGCCYPSDAEHPAWCDYAPGNRDEYGRTYAARVEYLAALNRSIL